jgi:hypothetical protein
MGALSSSKWSSIFSALSRVMKLWEAPVSKRHKISCLEIFRFKKISWLLTHPQLLEGLKCESKWKTAEEWRVGARSLAHNTWGVEGRVGASGWD